jgi:hypothetical protein
LTELCGGRWLACHFCRLGFTNLGAHVRRRHGLSPEEYRARWALEPDTPPFAPVARQERAAARDRRLDGLYDAEPLVVVPGQRRITLDESR